MARAGADRLLDVATLTSFFIDALLIATASFGLCFCTGPVEFGP